jgi:pyruvate dehydrogenase E1 component alpha subunit
MTSTHRGHGNCLAKGADPKLMAAELLGKTTGYCKGKGGSMHIADFEGGNLGANGIVGGGLPIAVGAGISIQNRGTDQVAVCFFGDGASNQGTFHESLNFAALWKLPVLFVCENNLYALSTPLKEATALPRISDRAMAYGIPGIHVDGNDVRAVYAHAQEAVGRARRGEGPTLLDCATYRFFGHFTGDPGRGITYRSKEEMEEWLERCPIKKLCRYLTDSGAMNDATAREIAARVEAVTEAAVAFAESSPWPSPEDALQDVFA